MTEHQPGQMFAKWVIAVSVVIVIAIGSYGIVSRHNWPVTDPNKVPVLPDDLPEQSTTLESAQGKTGSGQAIRSYRLGTFRIKVAVLLPDAANDQVYTAWLVADESTDASAPRKIGSLTFETECGCSTKTLETGDDLRDRSNIIVTEERTDDDSPETTVLHGRFGSEEGRAE